MKALTASALLASLLLPVAIPAQERQPCKVGVSLPLSGNLASYGKSTLDGIKLKASQIDTAGGIGGRKLELIVEDNKGEPQESRNTYKKLAASDKVIAVLGPITSTNALSVRRYALELEVPVISPTATNDKVTLRNPYMFRVCFNDSFQGRAIARHAFTGKSFKTAAILMDMNSDYSKGLSKSFKEAFSSLGGKVVAEEGYQQKETEFGPQLKKIVSADPDVVFVPGYPPELQLIIKQAKVVGLKARLCGADGWDNDSVINGSGDNVEGCFIVGAFSREDSRPAVRTFMADFEKAYDGGVPGTFEALGYDSLSLLAEAIGKGAATPEEVKDALLTLKGVELVTGTAAVTPEGDVEKSAVLLEIRKAADGKFTAKYIGAASP